MSNTELRLNLSKIGGLLAIIGGLATLIGAWVILPYRMDASEARQTKIEERQDRIEAMFNAQQNTLSRIDENVKMLRGQR